MRSFIQSWSNRTEFLVVIALAFGWLTMDAAQYLYVHLVAPESVSAEVFSNMDLYQTIVFELSVLALVAVILHLRGWGLQDFNLDVSPRLTVAGGVLLIVNTLIILFLSILFAGMFPFVQEYAKLMSGYAGKPDTLPLILTVTVNAFYEEILVVGYVMMAVGRKRGLYFAMNVCVAIRLLCHLNLGPLAAIEVIPMGLLFAYVYARWAKLWPLIVAHVLMDIAAVVMLLGS